MIDSYKIVEAAKDSRFPGDVAYFVVEFYDAGRLVLTEDFQMPHLKTTISQPVTDANGDYVLMDGSTLTKKEIQAAQDNFIAATKGFDITIKDDGSQIVPQEIIDAQTKYLAPIDDKWLLVRRQTVNLDVAAQIKDNIERYIQTAKAKGISGDRRDKTLKFVDKQQVGVSQRPEVQALKLTTVVAPGMAIAKPPTEERL